MPRLTRMGLSLCAAIALACGLLAGSVSAQAAVIAQPTSTITNQAVDAVRSVTAFRTEIGALLDDYLARYGGRLAPAERTRMTRLADKVDVDLARLERTAASTARHLQHGRPKFAASSARRAALSYERAYAEATVTLAEVQPILQPHLGILEALEAKAQVDAQFARFRSVGDQLTSVSKVLNQK